MQQTRCINCMKEIAPDARYCPYCGCDQQAAPVSSVLRPNTVLRGRYLIGRVIGKGGFGITYVGFDLTLEMKVAVKEYYPSGIASRNNSWSNQVVWDSQSQDQDARTQRADSMKRVLKEARRTAKLSDVPAIVSVHDAFQENETAYIVMEFIEGITLKDYLARHGTLSWNECKQMLFPVMDALAQAHDLGIIHRDISPDNIMIRPDGTAKLLDLGAATDVNANDGHASTLVVKNHFSALEQYDENGKIGSWTDVYAFAAMLYYCLTGKLMTPVMDRLRKPEVTFPNGQNIPEQVKTALCRALAIYEDERTQDMREFQRALARSSNDDAIPKEDRLNSAGKRSVLGIAVVCVLVLTVMAGTFYYNYVRKTQQEEETENSEVYNIADGNQAGEEEISSQETSSEEVASIEETTVEVQMTSENVETSGEEETSSAEEKTTEAQTTTENVEAMSSKTNEKYTLMNDNKGVFSSSAWVFGSTEYMRKQIVSISFLNSFDDEPEDSWDVSEEQDGTIKAWVQEKEEGDGYHLFIASEGIICAPEDSSKLFECYENCETMEGLYLLDTSQVTDMSYMFSECRSLKELDVSGFDTSCVKNMYAMFYYCESLTELDISKIDTSQVEDMTRMFCFCGCLTQLVFGEIDTSQVEYMNYMFAWCTSLTQLDVRNFDTSNVTNMDCMFSYCTSLTELDVSGFDTSEVNVNYNDMFANCSSLTSLILWPDCSDSLRETLYQQTKSSKLTR